MLAGDALIHGGLKRRKLGEPRVPVKNDCRPVHKTVLARLNNDGLVGVWTFGAEVYNDDFAALGIDGGDENPQMRLSCPGFGISTVSPRANITSSPAQEVPNEGDALQFIFDGGDLEIGLSTRLEDVAVLEGNRATL